MSWKGALLKAGIFSNGRDVDLWKGFLRPRGRSLSVGGTTVRVILRDNNNDVLLCSGTTVPTAGGSGYAKGCLFIRTNAANGAKGMQENQGTNTSCLFVSPSVDAAQGHLIARATYDFSEFGGAIGTKNLGVNLPNNAIVTRAWYEVLTTCTSATDAATISLGIASDDVAGLKAAIAISDASNPWDSGLHECIQDGTAANMSTKTTAARALQMQIAVEALTAGKFIVFAEYVVSD